MKLFTGCVLAAGLVLEAGGANAQTPAPYVGGAAYTVVSDVGGPYAAMPPEAPGPRYGPTLLPAAEVYTIVRESGFSPLGIPQQRGLVYTIAVIDRRGDDGRLVIDARTGRIIRFMPAFRMGDNFNEDLTATYGAVGPLPPVRNFRGVPRPPRSIPHVASRTPSIPRPLPHAAGAVATPPAQQSVAAQAKPADPQAAAPAVEAKPAVPQIAPTQEMPKVQGLD